jgi:hypothetical protein
MRTKQLELSLARRPIDDGLHGVEKLSDVVYFTGGGVIVRRTVQGKEFFGHPGRVFVSASQDGSDFILGRFQECMDRNFGRCGHSAKGISKLDLI